MQQVQINDAVADILFRIKQFARGRFPLPSQPSIDFTPRRFRHNLHEPVRAAPADLIGIKAAFHLHDGKHQCRIKPVAGGEAANRLMIAPGALHHGLARKPRFQRVTGKSIKLDNAGA